jgi:hypothetical protein
MTFKHKCIILHNILHTNHLHLILFLQELLGYITMIEVILLSLVRKLEKSTRHFLKCFDCFWLLQVKWPKKKKVIKMCFFYRKISTWHIFIYFDCSWLLTVKCVLKKIMKIWVFFLYIWISTWLIFIYLDHKIVHIFL